MTTSSDHRPGCSWWRDWAASRLAAGPSSSTWTCRRSSSECGSPNSARRLGLGRRILTELERLALANGAETVRLETNRALVEAISLYRSAGYIEVPAFNEEPYAHHWFEKNLVGGVTDR